ncbi:hypothetical protein [Sphingobacterium sp. SGL-16]|uniref:hypothetical protein n=1 Tax=Sphingobacterium sp. SGL-16 TaxID=2710883 RepID=UPI0013E9CBCC|nr:hypothetical protein [Sphingobacterium sp. SGL-16]NGM71798.1 hypothetical protein [Sphingobacterium sp. SGL-16]
MKNLIDKFIKQNEIILCFLESKGHDYEQVDTIIPAYVDFLNQTSFNVALGTEFANLLQLSNDKNIYEKFELTDIKNLFLSFLKVQNYNLETYLEAACFEWNVMDNKEIATSIANEGIQRAKDKIEELQQLLKSINNE